MNKYKKLAMNTFIFAVGNFGSKILVYLLSYLYSKYLSPSDSSTKELLEITANFLLPIFTLSITEAIIRYGLDNNYDKREVFTSATCLCGLGLISMLVFSPLFHFLSFVNGYTVLLLVYVCTSAFRSLCSQFVRARGLVKLFSFDGILTTLVLFLLNIVFIAHFKLGVSGFMLSVILSDFFSAVFLFVTAGLWKYLKINYFNKELSRVMLRFSLPLIPTILMWVITGFSDRLFIRYMHSDTVQLGQAAAGLYGYATKVPNLISMVSTIFFQAWNMSAITENDSSDRNEFYERVYSAYQAILYVSSAFVIAAVKIITPVNTSNYAEYGEVYIYTPLLVVGVILMCLNQFFSSIYTATRHTVNSFWTSLAASVVNIVLNFVLIGRYGIQGASVATLLSYLTCYLIRVVDARRYVPFKINHVSFIINMLSLLGMSVLIIYQPAYYQFMLFFGFLFVLAINYEYIVVTVKRLLKR